MDVQPTLFDVFTVAREWGRIGRKGRLRSDLFPSEAAAHDDAGIFPSLENLPLNETTERAVLLN